MSILKILFILTILILIVSFLKCLNTNSFINLRNDRKKEINKCCDPNIENCYGKPPELIGENCEENKKKNKKILNKMFSLISPPNPTCP